MCILSWHDFSAREATCDEFLNIAPGPEAGPPAQPKISTSSKISTIVLACIEHLARHDSDKNPSRKYGELPILFTFSPGQPGRHGNA
jgi:hypothetical protein